MLIGAFHFTFDETDGPEIFLSKNQPLKLLRNGDIMNLIFKLINNMQQM